MRKKKQTQKTEKKVHIHMRILKNDSDEIESEIPQMYP